MASKFLVSARGLATATASAAAATATAASKVVVPTTAAIRLTAHPVKGTTAVAARDLEPGWVINEFRSPVLRRPTMHTVCLDETTHVAPTQGAEFISHACGSCTNVRIAVADDAQSARFVVTKPVRQGEELAFNYNSTEWEMSCPFECGCPSCTARATGQRRLIRGFKFLSADERRDLWHETSNYIRQCVLAEEEQAAAKAVLQHASAGAARSAAAAAAAAAAAPHLRVAVA